METSMKKSKQDIHLLSYPLAILYRVFILIWTEVKREEVIVGNIFYLRGILLVLMIPVFFLSGTCQNAQKKKRERNIPVFIYNEYEIGGAFNSIVIEDISFPRATLKAQSAIGGRFAYTRIMSNRSIRILEFGLNYTDLLEIHNSKGDQLDNRTISGGIQYGSERKRLGYRLGIMFLNSIPSISGFHKINVDVIPLAKFILGRYDKVYLEVSTGDSFLYGIYRRSAFEFGFNMFSAKRYKNPQVLSYGIAFNDDFGGISSDISQYFEGDFTIMDKLSIKVGIQNFRYLRDLPEDWILCLSITYRPNYNRQVAVSHLVE